MYGKNDFVNMRYEKDFYEKLAAFAKMVDFVYSSYELFELIGFEQAEYYRRDICFLRS